MARGTVVGESIVSQARTKEFDEGYDRVFGPDRKPVRGKWVWDEAQQKLVSAEDYVPPEHATNAPILAGRFYENTAATDGTDIGSRTKHREYKRARGLADASDFSPGWYAKIKKDRERESKASRRDTISRALYKMDKP